MKFMFLIPQSNILAHTKILASETIPVSTDLVPKKEKWK